MKKILATVALSTLLVGCAAPSVTPPSANTGNHVDTYHADFSEVWEHAVDWFAINNIPIKNIERDSGIISSDYSLGAGYSQVDCGAVDPGGMHILIDQAVTANINVLVRDRSGQISVQPNVFGQGAFTFRNTWDNRLTETIRVDRCVTTGELERSLQNHIQSRI
ncbi:hypothetical protein [Halomonas alkalisoli]|uniref:hypothetical protein n=1 Tax=Halomonas alkalisoli TaxID=2907158 RepID=UPI001F3C1931|nr:hypothetical protein [Halomonas alkalisoli]MCE9681132.1 hypothetical protein [Halomonas alkalisoli]